MEQLPRLEAPIGLHRGSRVGLVARLAVGIAIGAGTLAWLLGRGRTFAVAVGQLGHLRLGFLVLAGLAEATSILAFARLQGLLLASGGVRVGMKRVAAIALGGTALQNSLPAGSAWSSLFAFRQFRRQGADAVLAGWVVVVEGLLVLGSVGVIAGIGVAVSTRGRNHSRLWGLGLVAALGAILFAAMVWWRRRARSPRVAEASRLTALVARIRSVSPSSAVWLQALALAVANVLADCACLILAFAAVRQPVPWPGLLTAYGVGQLASRLPITPGGLGLVEGGIAASLAAYGFPATATTGAVILYRLIGYWALTLVGWPAILWLARSEPMLGGGRESSSASL